MNPRAVQSERDRSDNNATVDVDEESEETPATSATDVDVELINAGTQTDESSLSQPSDCVESCIKHETRFLPSPNSELIKAAEQIVELHSRVCKRNDDQSICPPSRSHISFKDAFQNPLLICNRSKLTPTGERIASLGDVLQDWRRCFVLYIDWLREFPEFNQMSNDDQLILAKHRFGPFYWWLCANWSVQCGCYGVCYANGTYFPAEPTKQCLPDVRGVALKMVKTLVNPLKELQLDETERCIVFVICLFADELISLSTSAQQHSRQLQDRYLRIMCSHIRNSNPMQTGEFVAVRIARIMLLISSLTSLAYLTNDNIELNDVLHVVDWGAWSEGIPDGYKQFCGKY
uniref:Nuclear hormone receptor family member nhr-62 n=1 Tax=Ascaris suum TaxID=6253 RepID=F1L3P7_ASCSU